VGLCPTPYKLFEKSLTKTLTGNARTRISKRKGSRGFIPLWVFEGETLKVLSLGAFKALFLEEKL